MESPRYLTSCVGSLAHYSSCPSSHDVRREVKVLVVPTRGFGWNHCETSPYHMTCCGHVMHNMSGGWGLHCRWLTVGVVSRPLNDGFLYSSFQHSAFLVQKWTLAFSKELAVTFRCSWVLPCRCVSMMAVWFFSVGLSSVGCLCLGVCSWLNISCPQRAEFSPWSWRCP